MKRIVKKVKYLIEENYHEEKKNIIESKENRQTRLSAYLPLKKRM